MSERTSDPVRRLRRFARHTGESRQTYWCAAGLGVPVSSTLLDQGLLTLLPAAAAAVALGVVFGAMVRHWGLKPTTGPTGDEVLARLERSWEATPVDGPVDGPVEAPVGARVGALVTRSGETGGDTPADLALRH